MVLGIWSRGASDLTGIVICAALQNGFCKGFRYALNERALRARYLGRIVHTSIGQEPEYTAYRPSRLDRLRYATGGRVPERRVDSPTHLKLPEYLQIRRVRGLMKLGELMFSL